MRGPGGTALPALGWGGWDLFFLEGEMPLPLFGSLKPCLQAPSRSSMGLGCSLQPGCPTTLDSWLPSRVSVRAAGGSGDAKTGEGPDFPQG